MSKNTSIILGEHFNNFIAEQVKTGHYGSASEVVREGLRMVEDKERKRQILRDKLSLGKAQAERGETIDGETFMQELIGHNG